MVRGKLAISAAPPAHDGARVADIGNIQGSAAEVGDDGGRATRVGDAAPPSYITELAVRSLSKRRVELEASLAAAQ